MSFDLIVATFQTLCRFVLLPSSAFGPFRQLSLTVFRHPWPFRDSQWLSDSLNLFPFVDFPSSTFRLIFISTVFNDEEKIGNREQIDDEWQVGKSKRIDDEKPISNGERVDCEEQIGNGDRIDGGQQIANGQQIDGEQTITITNIRFM
jgi:hypothetical protein